jgi:hypothetical protein
LVAPPAPQPADAEQLAFGWQDILDQARREVSRGYGSALRTERVEVFGATSGFFMLPIHLAAARGTPEPVLFDLALCAAYGHAFHRLVDWQVDEAALTPSDALLLAPIAELYEAKLRQLAGDRLDYVNKRRRQYYRLFVAAHALEVQRAGCLRHFSSEELVALGDKSGPVMILFDLVDLVAPGGSQIDPTGLRESLRFLAVGLQLEDDLHDYADDFRAGNFTYPITTALVLAGLTMADCRSISTNELGGLLRSLQVDRHCHQLAASAFLGGATLAQHAGWQLLHDVAERCAATSRSLAHPC